MLEILYRTLWVEKVYREICKMIKANVITDIYAF